MINETTFWDIIRQSRKKKFLGGTPSHDQQINNLTKILSSLPANDIQDFDTLFHKLLNQSYTWRLWGAAYVINGGCSDDTFDYFRSWLIGQGRETFNRVMQDPETLADVLKPGQGTDWEGLEYCAPEAYEHVTGNQLEQKGDERPGAPTGEEWREEDLEAMFPKLWEKFSDEQE